MPTFTLPKTALIRTRAEYSFCYTEGIRLHTRHFLLFIVHEAEKNDGIRLGIAVSRKVGHAVVRNRIKRLIREVFRLHLRFMSSARIIVVAKKDAGNAELSVNTVRDELVTTLEKHFSRWSTE